MDPLLATRIALYLHLVAAFVLLSGVVASTILAERARRADTLARRRALLDAGPPFERLSAVGAPAAVVTGLLTLFLYGYPITSAWVLATGVILLGITVVEARYWPREGAKVRAALAADDDATAAAILRRPLSVAISRAQLTLAFVIVFLMVFRPG